LVKAHANTWRNKNEKSRSVERRDEWQWFAFMQQKQGPPYRQLACRKMGVAFPNDLTPY
jgi:hypothetical protein